jgi:type I restriction enzyme S subunit
MPELLGRACLYPGGISKAVTVVDVCIFRPGEQGVDPRWLMWWMNSPAMRQRILDLQTGTTRKRISRENLSKIPLPVPPLAEQHRIAAVLDAYLSRLSAGLSDVSRARRRVAEFWQSTLDRGIFGQSHEQNWPMSSLGQLSHGGDYGTSVKCSYDGQGAAVVRIPNILDGEVDLADMKYATDPSVDLSRLHLSVGDILFVRTNGSRSLIGRTAVVDGTGGSAAFASYSIRFRLRTEVVRPRWVHHVLQSSMCRWRLEREAASSAGQYNLSLAKLESILVPVPRLSEQDSILAELNDQRYANKRLGASLGVVEVRGEALRRSLLVDAFSGRLVPQDPNDEPASLLLERIKEERAAQPQPKRGRRSTKRTHPDQESML